MVCPWESPVTSVRSTIMSRVPFSISALGSVFFGKQSSTRSSMGRELTPLEVLCKDLRCLPLPPPICETDHWPPGIIHCFYGTHPRTLRDRCQPDRRGRGGGAACLGGERDAGKLA